MAASECDKRSYYLVNCFGPVVSNPVTDDIYDILDHF